MDTPLTCDSCLDNVSHIFCTYLSPEDVETIAGCLSSGEMADMADRGSPAKKFRCQIPGLIRNMGS